MPKVEIWKRRHGRPQQVTACGLLLLIAFSANGQSTGCGHVTAIASVFDENGIPIVGLEAAHFRASIQGKDAKLVSLRPEARPPRVALLIETSAGMQQESTGRILLARDIALHFLENGPDKQPPLVARFGQKGEKAVGTMPGEMIGRPMNLADLISGIDSVGHADKAGRLLDAVSEGIDLLGTPQPGDIVFVITTGVDNGSKTKARDLQERLMSLGVRLFAVTMPLRYDVELTITGPGSGGNNTVQQESKDFLNAVLLSNGKFLSLPPKRRSNEWGFKYTDEEKMALATSLQVLYLQMAKYYRLELEPATALDRSSSLKIDLRPPDALKKRKPQLTYSRKIFPCQPTP